MRILQICNRVPWPLNDGGAIAIYNMSKGFYSLGHELYMLCLNTRKHYVRQEEIPDLFKNIAGFKSIDINTDINKRNAAVNLIFSRKSYHVSRFYSKKFEKELIKTITTADYDIIQIEGLHMCIYIDVIRRHSRARISLRAHNLEYLIWDRLSDAEHNPLKRQYLEILTRRLLHFEMKAIKKVDILVPITENDGAIFREMGTSAQIFVCPAGLDLENYVINKSNSEWPGIFHLGALNWMPNIQAIEWFLKDIWPQLHSKYPEIRFYIAGRNSPEWLFKLKKVGVVAVGEVEDAVQFMNAKSIMVVPLLSGSGMRIKIIEGMALGKIIVATSIGAEGIDYEDGKNILIADNADEFVQTIGKCINNPGYAANIGKNARFLTERKYANEVLVGNLTDFYNVCLES